MNLDLVLSTGVISGLLAGIGTKVIYAVNSNLYAVNAGRRERKRREHPHCAAYRTRPLVSVVIPLHNDQVYIQQCMASIMASSYRKIEVIAIDNASSDNTSSTVKQFASLYPGRSIRVIKKRRMDTSDNLIKDAVRRYANGSLIMPIDAGILLQKHAIKHTVEAFTNKSIGIVTLNQQFISSLTVLGASLHLEALKRSQKHQLFSGPPFDNYAVYRRSPVKKPAARYYANNAVVFTNRFYKTPDISLLPKKLRATSLPTVMYNAVRILNRQAPAIRLLFVGYLLYLAVAIHQPALLGIYWLSTVAFTALALWNDTNRPARDKFYFSALLPIELPLSLLASAFLTLPGRLQQKIAYSRPWR